MIDLYKEKKEIDERYYRLGDVHIFSQMGPDQFFEIKNNIADKRHQKIHIFELYPDSIMETIKEIIEVVHSETKIIIHISHYMKDYKILMEEKFKDIKRDSKIPKYYIIAERKPVIFSWVDKNDDNKQHSIIFTFKKHNGRFQLTINNQIKAWTLRNQMYDYSNAAIRSQVQLNNPELFKDTIIKNFKRVTPDGILGTFDSDDDIWDFITDQGEWASKE